MTVTQVDLMVNNAGGISQIVTTIAISRISRTVVLVVTAKYSEDGS